MDVHDDTIALVPSPRSEFDAADDVALGRSQKGKLYRKQLLRKGTYPHPADASRPLVIDDTLIDTVIANFNAEVCDIVQVPVADDSNRHVEDPLRNIGEVIGLEKGADGDLYGFVDVRDESAAPKLGKTLLGTSAMMHLDYMDTRNGKRVGPTLLHALVTNRPYITGMEGYEEVVAASQRGLTGASADTQGSEAVVFATREEDTQMDKEQLIAALRDEHGIDVDTLQEELTKVQGQVAELSNQPSGDEVLRQALAVVKASGAEVTIPAEDDDVTTRDVADAVIELAHEHREAVAQLAVMAQEREEARLAAAASEVDSLIKEGRILPAQREGMVKLAQEDRDTFTAVVPASPIVDLTERGFDDPEVPDIETFNEEVARFTAMTQEFQGGKKQ